MNDLIPYVLLIVAILIAWKGPLKSAQISMGAAIASGLVFGRLKPISIVCIATLALSLWVKLDSLLVF